MIPHNAPNTECLKPKDQTPRPGAQCIKPAAQCPKLIAQSPQPAALGQRPKPKSERPMVKAIAFPCDPPYCTEHRSPKAQIPKTKTRSPEKPKGQRLKARRPLDRSPTLKPKARRPKPTARSPKPYAEGPIVKAFALPRDPQKRTKRQRPKAQNPKPKAHSPKPKDQRLPPSRFLVIPKRTK